MSILASVAAALLLVSVSVNATCTDNTFLCSGCDTLIACFASTEYPIPCVTGQVCGNDGADATIDKCFDSTDTSNKKQSECSCDSSATSASYIADPYDPAKYLACIPGKAAPESLACTGDEVFIEGQIPPCGTAPSTTTGPSTASTTTAAPFECSAVGFKADTQDCSKYWLCASDTDKTPIEVSCPAGESFNEVTLACFDPCDPSAVTFSCDGITGGVADSVNCSIFHICVNGDPVGQPIPCEAGKFFDSANNNCEGTTCATDGNSCLTCSTTAATTSTTADSTASDSTASDSTGSDSTSSDSTASDSTVSDSTVSDSTVSDSTVSDSTVSDSTVSDSTVSDSTASDSTSSDSTVSDSTVSDSTVSDSTASDSTASDSTVSDSTASDSTASDSTVSDSTASDSTMSDSTMSDSTTSGTTTGGVPDCSSSTAAGYHAGDSCKTYYACEPDNAGGHVLKEYTCPGSLVFSPTSKYCTLASKVPGC